MRILDATAGYRSMWFNKQNPLTTYIDIRPEVKPDHVMDSRQTTFPDREFDLILFDPPHVSYSKENKGIFAKKYGTFSAQEIRITIKEAFIEFYRILKDNGFVIFKWNTHSQKLEKILSLINGFEALFGQITAYKTKHSSQTYWVCLIKK